MPTIPITIDGTLRVLRVIHGVILYSMVLCVYSAEKLFLHEPRDLDKTVPIGFGIFSLLVIGLALYFRANKLQRAIETLQSKPDNVVALQQWRFVGILSAILAENVVLMGFALRFLGGSMKMSLPFYSVGIGLMILWWPRRP